MRTALVFSRFKASARKIAQRAALPLGALAFFAGTHLPRLGRDKRRHQNGKRVDVPIVAQGTSVSSSTGNRDSYLALVSLQGKGHISTAALLVDYHADDHDGFRYADQIFPASSPLPELCRVLRDQRERLFSPAVI